MADTTLTLKALTHSLLRISAAAGELQQPILDGAGQSTRATSKTSTLPSQGLAVELGQSLAEFRSLAGLDPAPIDTLCLRSSRGSQGPRFRKCAENRRVRLGDSDQ